MRPASGSSSSCRACPSSPSWPSCTCPSSSFSSQPGLCGYRRRPVRWRCFRWRVQTRQKPGALNPRPMSSSESSRISSRRCFIGSPFERKRRAECLFQLRLGITDELLPVGIWVIQPATSTTQVTPYSSVSMPNPADQGDAAKASMMVARAESLLQ